jgi:hypothetical protein
MLTVIAILFGAAAMRLRGSKMFERITGRGIGSARIMWAAVNALMVLALSTRYFWWQGCVLALGLFVILWLCSTPGWPGARNSDGSFSGSLGVETGEQAAQMSGRGLLWVGPAGLWLALEGYSAWPAILSGVSCGLIYWLCRAAIPRFAVEAAELIFGAAMTAALVLSVQRII